jgi:hypothetical protein
MKNKGIVLFLLILAAIIVTMIVADFRSERPGKGKPNPYAYNINEFKNVDPSLINYRESKNFRIGFESPVAIAVHDDKIYVAGDNLLKIIDLNGRLLKEFDIPRMARTIEVFRGEIYLADVNRIRVFSEEGNLLNEWEQLGENSLITGIASGENWVFVADAGNRRVLRYSKDGALVGQFDGKAEEGVLHGFIIPSPTFDLDINDDDELWVVNPGMHALENYTPEGNLRRHWKKTTITPEGFSGCCNPSYFTFLSDGRFVTSEKGLVRVKTYKRSGEFEGVVAAPDKFADNAQAPGVAADSRDNIYILDFDKKMIRVFEPI